MQERQNPWSGDRLSKRVSGESLGELQQAYPHLDVRKVYGKLLDRYGNVPTLATMLKWLSTERDPRSLRSPAAPVKPTPPPMRDPTCAACDGTGFVKIVRQVHTRGVDGQLRATQVTGRLTDAAGRLVVCDHVARGEG
jgi:hypothetical protein